MALIQCRFIAESIGMMTSATVVLPQSRAEGQLHQTLYLLHGLSDDDSVWLRRTSIERYADEHRIAVVMPQIHRSFYTDMVSGYAYWTFLSEELPRVMRAMFPLSAAREDNFVAGLSMGGYGAFKWALRKPEMFAAAASLSGALDVGNKESILSRDYIVRDIELIYGGMDQIPGTENDLMWLVQQHSSNPSALPTLFQCCGTEDFLYQDNVNFREAARAAGLSLLYEEGPGTHDWAYWDTNIRRVLDWLPLRGK